MNKDVWSITVPEDSGFYWAKWKTISGIFPVEVDPDGTVWITGSEADHAGRLLIGPEISNCWETFDGE
jgi:hypothetical protein